LKWGDDDGAAGKKTRTNCKVKNKRKSQKHKRIRNNNKLIKINNIK
jgi:hypothetical protein